MLVSPAGQLKSTAIEIIENFEKALLISDLTVKSVTAMREDIVGNKIRTLAFSDIEKIYKRHGSVSSNIEGIIMALAAEGFRNPAYSDQRIQALPARCAIIGAMTLKCFEKKQEEWLDNGFHRRFIWSRFRLADSTVLEDAIEQGRKAELDGSFTMKIPSNAIIPYNLTSQEAAFLRHTLRFQRDLLIPQITAQRIFAVLKWKFEKKQPGRAQQLWKDFAESLSKDGAILITKEEHEP